jgi:hypothetical protein
VAAGFALVIILSFTVEKVDSTDRGMVAMESLDSLKNRPVDAIIVPVENPDPVVPPDESNPRVIVEEMPTFPGVQLLSSIYLRKTVINFPVLYLILCQ